MIQLVVSSYQIHAINYHRTVGLSMSCRSSVRLGVGRGVLESKELLVVVDLLLQFDSSLVVGAL